MKNYINEEEKKKQIEQMWEEYERSNRTHTPEQHSNPSNDLDYDVTVDSNIYEDISDKREHGNKRKNKQGKQNKKKNKFSKIPDEDYI